MAVKMFANSRTLGAKDVRERPCHRRITLNKSTSITPCALVVCEDNIRQALERNPILVTALNPVIGHELGAAIAKQAYKEGRPIKDVALDMTELSADDLDRLLDPLELMNGGIKE